MSKVPCSKLEVNNDDGTRMPIDVDFFFKLVERNRYNFENEDIIRVYGPEISKLSKISYQKCGGTAKRLTDHEVIELILFLLKNKAAGRSLHHFTVLNCPLFSHNQERYVLEASGIHICYFIFDNHDCC